MSVTPGWTHVESQNCRQLVQLAIAEDMGEKGDLTSIALLPPTLEGRAAVVSRAEGVIAGLPSLPLVLAAIDPSVVVGFRCQDGEQVGPGAIVATMSGRVRSVLAAERTCLNFLQRLSGVATLTRRYVDAVQGLKGRILDTRKTTPGWRRLEKYAVRCGGGSNHRMGLDDAILIKDNHLAALRGLNTAANTSERKVIEEAVAAARRQVGQAGFVEVEVDTLAQLEEALQARPDAILLDNMPIAAIAEAVQRRNASGPGILLEVSGGVSLTNVRALADTGVDLISVGALTHSAPALDLAFDFAWE
jgi:nicotinate-nucleotide pyrophosphorylase (carboxylating)